jgi:hypothetical protein
MGRNPTMKYLDGKYLDEKPVSPYYLGIKINGSHPVTAFALYVRNTDGNMIELMGPAGGRGVVDSSETSPCGNGVDGRNLLSSEA